MKKILVIFGTRPEAIKMAPVVRELLKHPELFQCRVCVTAQHRQMLDQVLNLFNIIPDHDLNIMEPDQDLFEVTSRALQSIRSVLSGERPDLVLVQGDTTSTMSASLAAFYERIPVGHIEAGLRTGNKYAPFPEEINRRITSCIADIHFAPTQIARGNLLAEGIPDDRIWVTGNTVIDALIEVIGKVHNDDSFKTNLEHQFSFLDKRKRLILVTSHRRENFGVGFENICRALKQIADSRTDVEILYTVHLNPNVQEPVQRILKDAERVHLIEPQDYLQFVYLMDRSYLILTDSGGIQEEAPSLGKPVLIMRETTERPEAVDAGTAILVGTDKTMLVDNVSMLLTDDKAYKAMANAVNPFGDGKAASRILPACNQFLGGHGRGP